MIVSLWSRRGIERKRDGERTVQSELGSSPSERIVPRCPLHRLTTRHSAPATSRISIIPLRTERRISSGSPRARERKGTHLSKPAHRKRDGPHRAVTATSDTFLTSTILTSTRRQIEMCPDLRVVA